MGRSDVESVDGLDNAASAGDEGGDGVTTMRRTVEADLADILPHIRRDGVGAATTTLVYNLAPSPAWAGDGGHRKRQDRLRKVLDAGRKLGLVVQRHFGAKVWDITPAGVAWLAARLAPPQETKPAVEAGGEVLRWEGEEVPYLSVREIVVGAGELRITRMTGETRTVARSAANLAEAARWIRWARKRGGFEC